MGIGDDVEVGVETAEGRRRRLDREAESQKTGNRAVLAGR
jgi:hypothetical protein